MIRRALLLAVALVVLGATPAWAHGGPIAIDVRGDGGQGITATVVYERDGHAVTEQVDLTYTAVSANGKTVGPYPLTASAEGQSFYVSRNPLPLGDWTVTVTATHPSTASKTVPVTSAELPPVSPAPAPSGLSTTTLVAIPVAVAVLALAVAFALRRRRQARLT